jgi:UDP-glucose 4-epimerase
MKLGWKPELNDLPTMIEHAHSWEKNLTAGASGIGIHQRGH